MSLEELATHYKTLYKFIQSERLMRCQVFPEGHPKRVKKLADADAAMQAEQEKHFVRVTAAAPGGETCQLVAAENAGPVPPMPGDGLERPSPPKPRMAFTSKASLSS